VVSADLPPQPSSASAARALAREELAGLPSELVDTVSLLVTELVTNAVLHARTALHLDIEVGPRTVVLQVRDGSPRQPVVRHYGTGDVTGRGLALVEALSSDWGVRPAPPGKLVWCEVLIPNGKAPP
jgi:anti-sigma regulatory factor (Ser/Thr protein kinase)